LIVNGVEYAAALPAVPAGVDQLILGRRADGLFGSRTFRIRITGIYDYARH
jgi:hypothetical protein